MMRTIWCGQVSAPKESTSSAASRSDGSCPSGPPMAITSDAARPPSRSAAMRFGEIFRGNALAALVEQDERRARGRGAGSAGPLPRACARRTSAPRLSAISVRPENSRPMAGPLLRKAFEIAVGKFLLGAGLHAAHGKYRDLHPSSGLSGHPVQAQLLAERALRGAPSGSSLPRGPAPATSFRGCRTRGFRGGRRARSRRPHRSAPSRRRRGPRPAQCPGRRPSAP